MEKTTANLYKLSDRAFAIVGDDGLTNFGIVKGDDGSALLIDGDIRRMDEIDDALQRTGCRAVRYHLNTHENFDHSSANQYFEKNGAVVIGSDGCWEALKEDGEAKFAEMAGRSPELWTRYPDLKMGQVQVSFCAIVDAALARRRGPGAVRGAQRHEPQPWRCDRGARKRGHPLRGRSALHEFSPGNGLWRHSNWIKSIDHLLGQSFDLCRAGPRSDFRRERRATSAPLKNFATI